MSAPYNFKMPSMTQIKCADDIPSGISYIIQFYNNRSIHHNGDQRSKDAPGHGYPEYTEQILEIEQFVTKSESDWRMAIQALLVVNKNRDDFVAFISNRPNIKTKIEIEINTGSI